MGHPPDRQALDRAAEVAARFDRAAGTYERTGVDFFTPFGARLVELAAPARGDRVLDVGCGTGAVLLPAAHAVGHTGTVLGIDLAEAMVHRCQEAIAAAELTWAEARLGDAGSPEVVPDSFDHVLAGLVLFFLPDPLAALGAYRTALVPGGSLGFTTFGEQDPRFLPVFLTVAAHARTTENDSDDATAARRAQQGPFATPESIEELLRRAGFVDVEHREDRHSIRFDDAEQWIRWSWSHGMRELWESIPPASLDDAQQEAVELLDGLTDDRGLVQNWVLRTTLARTQ